MAKLSVGQKADRVLKLLLGLHNPRSVALLGTRGFSQEDLDEGWRLLRGLRKVRFDVLPPEKADPTLIVRLDQWENTWFPVADATLTRHFPAIRDKVFLNISQTEGPAVVLSVGSFVERVAALRDGNAESREAANLLAKRGLTPQVLAEARDLLQALGKPSHQGPPPDLEEQRREALASEEALWSWYLEWSRIARGVISDRNLLRELGFLRSTRSGAEESVEDEDVDGTETESPATTGPAPAAAGE